MRHFTGLEYLRIDVANKFGMDKENWQPRLDWVHANEAQLETLVDKADDTFPYLAAVMAYRDAQNGIPTGHLVGLDACASGPQIMAALTGCKVTALNTSLIGKVRNDLYTKCTDAMGPILGEAVTIPRGPVKSAQMPYFYGSEAKPKEVFGDGTPEYYAFHKANRLVAPGACELRDLLISSWQDDALAHDWILPDGFHAKCKVMVTEESDIEVDEMDHATFSYRHKVNRGIAKGEKGSKSMAAK